MPISGSDVDLQALETMIGHAFNDRNLLTLALTHCSQSHSQLKNNERLEFLGDRVLNLVLTDFLIKKYPAAREGFLTEELCAMVNSAYLFELAIELGLDRFLNYQKKSNSPFHAVADAIEAIIGAVYLDSGFESAAGVVKLLFQNVLDGTRKVINYKSAITDLTKKFFNSYPTYRVTSNKADLVTVDIRVRGMTLASASGYCRIHAEYKSARTAFEELTNRKGLILSATAPMSVPFSELARK